MLSAQDVERLARQVARGTSAAKLESLTIDFKTESPSSKQTAVDLAEAAVCFANSSGGVVIVGVRDEPGGPDALIGTKLGVDLVRQRIHELTDPHLTVDAYAVDVDDVRLLVIAVPEGLEVYATTKGHSSRRFATQCRPMRPDEMVRLAEERRGIDWSAQLVERDASDADQEAVVLLRELVSASGRPGARTLEQLSDVGLIEYLGFASGGRLTRAGELMLCQRAANVADDVVVYQHRRTPGGEADAVQRWGTPLITAFMGLMRAVTVRQGITPVTLSSGVQVQIEDFPITAIREAVINALAHGDHRYREGIRVVHSPDLLSITSPGPLVTGVTTSNILTVGKPRFALLARGFRQLGLAEDLGQGVDRMFRDMIRSGREVPTISESTDRVEVTLSGGPPNKRIAQFIEGLPAAEQDDTDTLLVIRALCETRTVSAAQLHSVIQRPASDAQRVLLRLSSDQVGLLEPTSGTLTRRFPNYRLRSEVLVALGPSVRYHRRAQTDIDRKVVDHVREYGYINNGTIQRLFDLDVFQARDLLRALVGRELLVRTSEQSRGPAVRYGRGPSFPLRTPRPR
jgi:ATP-dependent DNA helicase RecG